MVHGYIITFFVASHIGIFLMGYLWGKYRGVISVLNELPDRLKPDK